MATAMSVYEAHFVLPFCSSNSCMVGQDQQYGLVSVSRFTDTQLATSGCSVALLLSVPLLVVPAQASVVAMLETFKAPFNLERAKIK